MKLYIYYHACRVRQAAMGGQLMFKPMGKLGHGKDSTGSRAQQQHASESCFVAKHPVHSHADTEIDSGKHELLYSCVSKCFF